MTRRGCRRRWNSPVAADGCLTSPQHARTRLPCSLSAIELPMPRCWPPKRSIATKRSAPAGTRRAHNASLRAFGGRRGVRGSRARGRTGWGSLTRSELAVAELVAEGLTNREIGKRLFISPHTVNTHLRHCFRKLDVNTRSALAVTTRRASQD
ncbi:MAG: response regulator transcription factor [Solirubrobacteraceae bacterium]